MIAPSVLAADLAHLADEAHAVAGTLGEGADWLHVDVMDAHFVPNLTIGLPVVQALLRHTTIPLDCHLLIDDPDRWATRYAKASAHNVTVPVEATHDPVAIAKDLRAAGAKAGLSFKPETPIEPHLEILKHYDTLLILSAEPGFGGQRFILEVLNKVRTARRLVDSGHLRLLIEIAGGVNGESIVAAAKAGVDCFVAGAAVYGPQDPAPRRAGTARKGPSRSRALLMTPRPDEGSSGQDGPNRPPKRGDTECPGQRGSWPCA